jgi:hypothetical protein
LPEPLAHYDPDSSSWRTCEDYLPLGLDDSLDEFSGRWPTSGMTRSGTAYALPTSAPRMDAGGSSLLLPTPSVADGMGGHLTRSGDRSGELLLPGVAKTLAKD